jgi:hypothetical protein
MDELHSPRGAVVIAVLSLREAVQPPKSATQGIKQALRFILNAPTRRDIGGLTCATTGSE